ncbi:hypothetical protein KIL84_008914 [Mauremys mutica]|uniref:Uncharacterized protein n=1 Tax=Mauremys mutica TaxID=74926 RepID=A0A9D3X8Q3_9SAUR|nr:hypothetical protein KIL84_008914 [Mauremys mutica]
MPRRPPTNGLRRHCSLGVRLPQLHLPGAEPERRPPQPSCPQGSPCSGWSTEHFSSSICPDYLQLRSPPLLPPLPTKPRLVTLQSSYFPSSTLPQGSKRSPTAKSIGAWGEGSQGSWGTQRNTGEQGPLLPHPSRSLLPPPLRNGRAGT